VFALLLGLSKVHVFYLSKQLHDIDTSDF